MRRETTWLENRDGSDGEGRVSGQRCLEKTGEPAQKAGRAATSLWVRKHY